MTTPNVVIDNPWDSGENPQIRHPEYWGQVGIDMSFCVLVKGVGKVPFDAQTHSVDQRRTAIEINIQPIPEMNANFNISRGMIAESREWAGTILPSIKALGISPRELNGKYVHVAFKATGESYVNKNGESKEKTTFEFAKLFQTIQDCTADYLAQGGHAPQDTQYQAPATAAPTNGNGKEKETALKFLKVVVENAAKGQSDLGVIQATVAANLPSFPMVNKYFTSDSPETLNLIAEVMAK